MRVASLLRAPSLLWATSLLRAAWLLLAVLVSGVVVEAGKKTNYMDQPIPEWREGPVRYIITRSEDQEYKQLRTEEDRARFIDNFWRRRDTTPDTPGNEFRAEFWRRVRDANRLYREFTPTDAWRSDMGKIHIIKGPPDDITRDLVAEGHRGTIVWTYRNSGVAGVGPNAVIAFARDASGEFRLSTEPTKDADPRAGIPVMSQPPLGTSRFARAQILRTQAEMAELYNLTDPLIRQAGGPAMAGPLALVTDLVKLQQPPREWELRETVTTQEFMGGIPMRARADFFKTTGETTLVILSVAVRSSAVTYRRVQGREVPDLVFYARILDVTGNDLVASLEKDTDFAPASENQEAGLDDDLVHQARLRMAPGSYKVQFSVLDRAGGRAGSYQTNLTVPDFAKPELEISSILLARSIAQMEPGAQPPAGGAYTIGSLRVLPRVGQTFGPGDSLSFYYQVYGARPVEGAEAGAVSLDVDYGFYGQDVEKVTELGHVSFQDQKNAAHGYTLSLKDWPAGPYMLRVTVTDRLAQASVSRDLLFELKR